MELMKFRLYRNLLNTFKLNIETQRARLSCYSAMYLGKKLGNCNKLTK
jgi:hypothetical protein